MNHFRRSSKTQKDRYEIGMQSEPNFFAEEASNIVPADTDIPSKSVTLSSATPAIRSENVGRLVQGMDKAEIQNTKTHQNRKKQSQSARKSINLNMMRLQDKHFELKGNIYNIAVGQIINRQAYLATLSSQIDDLKSKIHALQEEDEQFVSKNINLQMNSKLNKQCETDLERSRTIQARKSNCGKIFTRLKTPSSERANIKFGSKDSEASSFYKWKPQVEDFTFADSKYRSSNFQKNNSQEIDLNSTPSKGRNENNQKMLSSYRLRQKTNNKSVLEKNSKYQNNPENQEKLIDIQPYNGIVFRKDVKQWQITKIEDNFRQKIMKKLQIPQGFPMQTIETGFTLEQYEQIGRKIFTKFGVKLQRQTNKLITRKFKNGIYFQLAPGKNALWYYSGTFYFGDWETDLPTESQKNGFGFQYVPNKYIYLGQFKDGMRNGKGTIKILADGPSDSFMGYDGEWAGGKPNGYGKHIDQKNTKYIGHFVAGQKTGSAIIRTQEGLYYEGQIKKGLKHGKGAEKLVNGDSYVGQFEDGKFNGIGTYKWVNGSIYVGEFVKGKRQGKGKWKGAEGDEFQGEYFDDIKNGWGKFTWANGQIYQGEFRNDLRHGEGTYKHPNGKLGKFMWVDGKIDHRIYTKQQEQYRCRNLIEQQTQ